jgi:hypothetical protein
VKGAAIAAAVAALASAGLPAVAAAVLVVVIVAVVVCWVIADAGRAGRAAELLRAAHGEQASGPPEAQERALPAGRKRSRWRSRA